MNLKKLTNIDDMSAKEAMNLIAFYNKFPQWRLIEKIIELEHIDTLRDILAESN